MTKRKHLLQFDWHFKAELNHLSIVFAKIKLSLPFVQTCLRIGELKCRRGHTNFYWYVLTFDTWFIHTIDVWLQELFNGLTVVINLTGQSQNCWQGTCKSHVHLHLTGTSPQFPNRDVFSFVAYDRMDPLFKSGLISRFPSPLRKNRIFSHQ